MRKPCAPNTYPRYLITLFRSIIYASTTVLEHILCHEQCDVDIQNKLQRDTPLHLAVGLFTNLFHSSGSSSVNR